MKMSKVSFITIYMLALALVLVGYFYLVYQNLDKKIADLDTQRQEYDAEYVRLVDALDKTEQLKSDIAEKTELQTQLQEKLANTTALNIADEVYRAMAAVGLNEANVKSVSVGDTQESSQKLSDGRTLLSVSIALNVESDYTTLQSFLQQFENNEKSAFYVPSVSMSKGESSEVYTVSITYYYADKVASKTVDTTTSDDGTVTDEDVEKMK